VDCAARVKGKTALEAATEFAKAASASRRWRMERIPTWCLASSIRWMMW
jgi:hypothetical protein